MECVRSCFAVDRNCLCEVFDEPALLRRKGGANKVKIRKVSEFVILRKDLDFIFLSSIYVAALARNKVAGCR